MNRVRRRWLFAAVVAFFAAGAANAATVQGTVNNGTTGKPAAGVEVILIQLQGGMQPVANTKSDSSGRFTFDHPGIGAQPMLVRAVYKGVNFHQALPPGKNAVTVDVFEPTENDSAISITSHVVIFQPNGGSLTVGEEYGIANAAKPPQAYFKTAGNFLAVLPQGAQLKQIAASGPSGMPVVQAPLDKGNNSYAIAFAFRPGESEVRLSYELPYPDNAATVKLPTHYGGARLLVVAPPSVQLSGDGLRMAGQEQGMNIYERANVDAGTLVSVSIAGTAPPLAAGGADGGTQARGDAGPGNAENAAIQTVPGRLDTLKWPIIGGFLVLFVLAAVLLARKPVAVQVAAPEVSAYPAAQATTAVPPVGAGGNAIANLGALDAANATSLDALKDQLFRLELRRQAGTISDEEYTRERSKAEQFLRELVRG